jgi:hypothetical protein
MTDSELLTLAGKAIGLDIGWNDDTESGFWGEWRGLPQWMEWNPLEDDGDALRLSVTLGIQIHQEGRDDGTAVWADQVMLWTDGDTPAATRRAIVMAAAARNQTNTKD